jgi:hypothetical protein
VKRVVVHDPDHALCSLTVLSHKQLCIQAVWDECAMNPSLWALVHRQSRGTLFDLRWTAHPA